MAPRETDCVGHSTVTHSFKVTDKAPTLPVLSDAVPEISKITAPNTHDQDEVESCVTNLDSLACNGLDQLTYTLPTWRSATPDLVETTEETASNYEGLSEEHLALVGTTNNYGGILQEYLASFKIAQLGIRLADSGLAILESPLSLVSDSISSKVQNVRRHLRFVRRAGATLASSPTKERKVTDEEDSEMDPDYVPSTEESQDSMEYRSETEIELEESQEVDSDVVRRAGDKRAGHPSEMGSVVLEVLAMFRLDILLGVLGMQLVEEPLASSPTKERKVMDDEDSEMDPDYVLSIEETEDSLEYRSQAEIDQEVSQEVEVLEDCSTTPTKDGSHVEEYLASFRITQLGIRLAESGLSILESLLSLVFASSQVQQVRRHLRVVRRAGEKRAGHPSKKGSVLLQVLDMFQLNYLLGVLGMQLVEEPLTSIPTKKRKVIDDEDSEMDPDFVPSIVESQDSLEYRSDSETEIELEVSQELDSDVEELEDCPNTVWTSLACLVGKVTDDEDSEMDPDFVLSILESQDSLEYRSDSETEIELEVSQEVDSDVEELEDCPDTVWTSLACLVEEVTDEDSEVDLDFVPGTEESRDSLEYRSESELELEESGEVDSDVEESEEVEELEDCPTTPNCVKVEHKIGKISEQTEAGGHVEEELDEEYERFRELKLKNLKDFGS
eukprot:GFUD01023743.1.p1 GENE.GFUD01023743.1~~GFUD01023743.1.p1  ORF type:complete len:671 (+),score=233.39 GFUD01023743.1:50-2062(+)